MRLFLRNIVLFITPLLMLFFTVEIILPPTLFTFRTWEAVRSSHSFFVGPFYPQVHYEMVEAGDLAHHTKFAIEKDVNWRTDKLGFRNNHYISNPDILLIGDSNIAGSSLSQEETLAYVLNQCTGLSVYSLAPADMNTYISLKNVGIMQVPQILILSSIERSIPSLPSYNAHSEIEYAQTRLNSYVQFFAIPLDKLFRLNSLSYLKSRMTFSSGTGTQSTIDDRMF